MKIPDIFLPLTTGRKDGNGQRLTTEVRKNPVSSFYRNRKPSSLGCRRNGCKGKRRSRLSAGCRPRCQPRCQGESLQTAYFKDFSLLTTKATKKSEKKKSGKETVCRGLCTGFLNARCQTSLSGSHPTGRPHAAPGRQRSGLFYGGKCLWQKQSRAAIRQRRRNRNGSAGASGSSSPVSLQAAKPCSKPLSSLLSGRPVNGLRNGWGKKPVKRLKSGEKQLKGRRGHGTIIVSCPCS